MSKDIRYQHKCPDCGGQLLITRLEVDTSIVITPSGYSDKDATLWDVTHLEISCSKCNFSQSGMINK